MSSGPNGASGANVSSGTLAPLSADTGAVGATGIIVSTGGGGSRTSHHAPATTNAPAKNAAPPKDQIPAAVKAFDKQRVALKGFMLPLKVEGGLITELLIMRDQSMCCYGTVPKINEWVSVKMTGKGVKPIMDQAVTLYGKLHVGEIRENGYLVGIYQMDGEKVAGPLDL